MPSESIRRILMAIFGKRTEDLRAQTHDFRHLEL